MILVTGEFATTTTSGEDHFLAFTKNGGCFSAYISHLLNKSGKPMDNPLASFRKDLSTNSQSVVERMVMYEWCSLWREVTSETRTRVPPSHFLVLFCHGNDNGNLADVTGETPSPMIRRRLDDPVKIKMHQWRVFSTGHWKSTTNHVQE